jgi:hypothetical protein
MNMKNAHKVAIFLILLGTEAFSDTAQRISDKLGYWSVRPSEQRLRKISLGGQDALVAFLVEDSFTRGLMEHGFWTDSIFIMRQVFYTQKNVAKLRIIGLWPATELPSEGRLRVVGEIIIDRSEFNRLPPDGVSPWMVKELNVGYFQ